MLYIYYYKLVSINLHVDFCMLRISANWDIYFRELEKENAVLKGRNNKLETKVEDLMKEKDELQAEIGELQLLVEDLKTKVSRKRSRLRVVSSNRFSESFKEVAKQRVPSWQVCLPGRLHAVSFFPPFLTLAIFPASSLSLTRSLLCCFAARFLCFLNWFWETERDCSQSRSKVTVNRLGYKCRSALKIPFRILIFMFILYITLPFPICSLLRTNRITLKQKRKRKKKWR